jgi:hypothetical protein
MERLAFLILCAVASGMPYAHADEAAAMAVLRGGCAEDAQRLCAGVPPGGGRVLACLKEHKDTLSDKCKQAAQQAASMSGGNPAPAPPSTPSPSTQPSATAVVPSTPPSAGAASSPVISPKPSTKSSASSVGRTAASDAGSGSYLRMKKAQITGIISAGPNAQPQPMVEMLIPTTWEFKGGLQIGGSKSGCFCDIFAIVWEAKNADGNILFSAIPNYSWQYSDDPQEMQRLNDPNRRARRKDGTVCPVSKPLSAEQFFRENLLPQLPSGATVVSIDPYPELNEMARQQMGLSPNDTGNGVIRTDAIRARAEFQIDNKPVEAWLTAAVVMRTFRVGRGSLYDFHAIDLMAFSAPKGKLAGNEKLLRVMMTSVRLTPDYSAFANKNIADYYQTQAKKEAAIDQVNANLQNDITQIYRQMSANSARVSQQGFLAVDQNLRGVQTFRDPSTGQKMELSNQYDHAWLNGAGEYVMSDDANFNPNAQLSGSWNQLQAVSPSP